MQRAATPTKLLTLVIVLTVVWGTNWGLFPLAVREVSVWTFRAICLTASGALVLLVAHLRGLSLRVPVNERKHIVAAGLCYLVIWNVASTYAAVLLPSGQAAVLGFTMPIWAALLSWLVFKERLTARMLIGVLMATMGVAFLAYAARGAYASAPLGFIYGLGAGLGWAGGTLILKRANLTAPSLVSTGWQLLIAAAPITVVAFIVGTREAFMPSWTTVLVIGYIAIVPMTVGNVTWFAIVKNLPATVSGLSAVMVPMVAMVTGAAWLGEPLGALQIAAMACSACAMGVVLVKHGSV
jgi:drug/metabolite transporter (DMT)-like permease